ncbi:hypothetical protein GF420_01715 [candidate division GN15 bacterium]|nr:hypothetical protein [candidate division GN15 bacterium]
MSTGSSKALTISVIVNIIALLVIVYISYKALEYRANVNTHLDRYNRVVEEFTSRDVYREANRPLRSDTIVSSRVVFFGTTMTHDWPVEGQFAGWEAINRGVAMQRLAGTVLRFRSDVIELMPQAVVVEVSSYNFREPNTLDELREYTINMAELADYHGIVPILTTVIPPTEGYEPYESDYAVFDSLAVFNDWLTDWCTRKGFPVADFSAVMADEDGYIREELTTGGIIPNQQGYDALAEAVRQSLAELGQSKN